MKKLLIMLTSLAAAVFVAASASVAFAQQDYQTPQDAAAALLAAAKSGDSKAALAVFGRDVEEIVSSGDKVADENARKRFVASYETKHEIKMDGERKATLIIGDNDYPFPVPLVRVKGMWSFDTDEGLAEILYRRIGHNELRTIQTCLAYVDAQNEYAEKDRTGAGAGIYAQHFVSEAGKKDGLYWPTAQGEPESPLGELFASASKLGYRTGEGRAPFQGYYYKILTRQGSAAPGGALNYIVNGKMIGGFALVAYPAEYRNSGAVTFIVNHSGIVFQKDLGPNTIKEAESITAYDPGKGWKKVEETASAK
jgi:Protein of unknown function (DUF2950)